jgi:hypothetical protein
MDKRRWLTTFSLAFALDGDVAPCDAALPSVGGSTWTLYML